jgi:hypothetical protein
VVGRPGGAGTASRPGRLALPDVADPLAPLLALDPGHVRAAASWHRAAAEALADEVFGIFLGWDTSAGRLQALNALLEGPVPRDLPLDFLIDLAGVWRALEAFGDVEEFLCQGLFDGRPETERTLARRLKEANLQTVDDRLLAGLVALAHHGLNGFDRGPAFEDAVARLFVARERRELHQRLALAIVRRILMLARAGVDLTADQQVARVLSRLTAPGHALPPALAHLVVEAQYVACGIGSSAGLAGGHGGRAEGPDGNPPRPDAASPIEAHVARLQAAAALEMHTVLPGESTWIQRFDFVDGRSVIAAAATPESAAATARDLRDAASDLHGRAGCASIDALELLVFAPERIDPEPLRVALAAELAGGFDALRFTAIVLAPDAEDVHLTFVAPGAALAGPQRWPHVS